MRIMIVGAGRIGYFLSEKLSGEGHDVTLVDRDKSKLRRLEQGLNILTVHGSGASSKILEQGGIDETDLFIAVTDSDEVNLIACIISKQFNVKTRIARVRNEEFFWQGSALSRQLLGIDLLISPDLAMSDEIVRLSARSKAFEIVEFAGGQVVLLGYVINRDNTCVNQSLDKLKGLRGVIVAIIRDGVTIIPRGDDVIKSDDKVYIVVRKRDVLAVERRFNLLSHALKNVFIIGGGAIAFLVARRMERNRIDVRLVERDPARCEYLTEHLDKTIVLNFDGMEANALLEEGIDRADLVVSVTNTDSTNILSSLLAKHHGAKRCITHLASPDFIPMLGKLGIDVALSPRQIAANLILRYVRAGGLIISAATLMGGDAEVIEVKVPDREQFRDKKLKDISFPTGSILGAIVRYGRVIIPYGDTRLHSYDTLVIFFVKNAMQTVEAFFSR